MDADDWLTGQFEQHRPRLYRLCYRMLGSSAEADDALQDAWVRVSGSGPGVHVPDLIVSRDVPTPADEAVLADSVSLALLVVRP